MNWPLPNVWLGVSVEDQPRADERIVDLLLTPAAVRFVSYEPALGPVNFTRIEYNPGGSGGPCFINALTGKSLTIGGHQMIPKLNWVIVGGESGPGARGFDVRWAHNTVGQCRAFSVACFVKQIGAKPFNSLDPDYPRVKIKDKKGGSMEEWPINIRVREFPHA